MRMLTHGTSYQPGVPNGPKLVSEVRRTDSGKWESRLTTESSRESLREAEKNLGESKSGKVLDLVMTYWTERSKNCGRTRVDRRDGL